MRTLSLFLFSIILVFAHDKLDAQNFVFSEGKWFYEIQPYPSNPYRSYMYFSKIGDTLLNGISASVFPLNFYVYSDSNKVYYYESGSQKFELLYDFNAEAGESWVVNLYSDSVTVSVDSVSNVHINNNVLKVQHITLDNPYIYWGEYIIENIGSNRYFIPFPAIIDPTPGPLRCYEDSILGLAKFVEYPCDTIIDPNLWNSVSDYPTANSISYKTYPNPVQTTWHIQSKKAGILEMYSGSGREVSITKIQVGTSQINVSEFPEGIYFYRISNENGLIMKSGKLVIQ